MRLAVATLLVISISCCAAIAQSTPSLGIAQFDANHNCVFENSEFFQLIDAWGAGNILEVELFAALDLWINERPIPNCRNSNERTPENACNITGSLHASYQGDIAHTPVIIGATQVDLFLTGATMLPAGTNISINISTGSQELVVVGGGFVGLFQGIRLTATNRNFAFGSASTTRDGTLSSRIEFARFTLQAMPVVTPTFTYVTDQCQHQLAQLPQRPEEHQL